MPHCALNGSRGLLSDCLHCLLPDGSCILSANRERWPGIRRGSANKQTALTGSRQLSAGGGDTLRLNVRCLCLLRSDESVGCHMLLPFFFCPAHPFIFFKRVIFQTSGDVMRHFLVFCAPADHFHWSSTQDSEQYFCQQLNVVGSQSLRQSWQWPQNQSVDLRESHYKVPRIAFFLLWGIKRFPSSCRPHSLPSVCRWRGTRLEGPWSNS